MKKTLSLLASTSLLTLTAAQALAQDSDYDASISLGYVATSGNTDTQTFNTEFLLTWDTANWTHNLKFQGLGSSEDGETTAERYYLENKSDYNLDETQYLYGKGTYTDDRFSGFDYQASVSAGYGRHLYTTDRLTIQGYGGLGYRKSVLNIGGDESEAIVALGESLEWQLSDTATLTQSFDTEIGEEITVTKFEVALESVIVDRIATRLSFFARNISDVPPGVKKTDTQTSVSLVYEF